MCVDNESANIFVSIIASDIDNNEMKINIFETHRFQFVLCNQCESVPVPNGVIRFIFFVVLIKNQTNKKKKKKINDLNDDVKFGSKCTN